MCLICCGCPITANKIDVEIINSVILLHVWYLKIEKRICHFDKKNKNCLAFKYVFRTQLAFKLSCECFDISNNLKKNYQNGNIECHWNKTATGKAH